MTKKLPKATHQGTLKIGDIKIPCAVLEDGTRVLSEHGITTALRSRSGGSKRLKKEAQKKGGAPLPVFLAPQNLKPFISEDLYNGLINPIKYQVGNRVAHGFPAELLPKICDVWLKARDHEALQRQQMQKCKQAEILIRGFAHVGIIALVDEATGYQYERDRQELEKILEAYIAKELLTWTKRFPDEFYRQLFRLRGWQYSPLSIKRPQYVGKLTNELIYEKLPPGVINELRKKNPTVRPGYRRHKHHQFLTEDIGNPHLERHIASVTTLMRAASNWRNFERLFKRAFSPDQPEQLEMFEDGEDT